MEPNEKKILNLFTKSGNDIFLISELMGQSVQDFIKYAKHYPNLWRKIIDDMSGYIVPDYFIGKYYKIPFEVENIWVSPDEPDDLPYTDYSINLLLPNINKLTEKQREDLIAAIYYDCYDLGVDVIFNNKKYNRRDRRISASVHSINGNPLSKEKIKKILDTEDFIDNETIEKLMNKMGMMNESNFISTETGLDINKESDPSDMVFVYEKHLSKMFCKKFGCQVIDVIGTGTQGVAVKVKMNNGDDKILKITQDKTEINSAKKLYHKNPKHLPIIEVGVGFKSEKFLKSSGKIFGILMDEYKVSDEISKLVDRTLNYIDALINDDDLIEYLKTTKKGDDNYNNVYYKLKKPQPNLVWYFDQLLDVVKELIKYDIESYDFHGMNFGINKKGNLVYFDIGYGENVTNNEPDEYVLFEDMDKNSKEFDPNNFDVNVMNKLLGRLKFNEYVSDVKFEGVGVESGHPVFNISFVLDYLGNYKKGINEPIDFVLIINSILSKVNTLIQMIDNPHSKGVWYQIGYTVYDKTYFDEPPMKLKKSYFLS